jgi:hypothetical protein
MHLANANSFIDTADLNSVEKSEEGIRDLITSGASIAEAREKLGYHTLQRKGHHLHRQQRCREAEHAPCQCQ